MVEVFKTNIDDAEKATVVQHALKQHLNYSKVTFDLQDCDRVLRIEAEDICNPCIINLLEKLHCECAVLSD